MGYKLKFLNAFTSHLSDCKTEKWYLKNEMSYTTKKRTPSVAQVLERVRISHYHKIMREVQSTEREKLVAFFAFNIEGGVESPVCTYILKGRG